MSTTTIAVIVVAAVGLFFLAAALVWLAQRTRKHQRHNKAEDIRGEAAAHRSEAATSRDDLDEQWEWAEKLDPAAPTEEASGSTQKEPQSH
jgi:hypothetical protein